MWLVVWRCSVYSSGVVVCGVWYVVCSVWCVACGVWRVACGVLGQKWRVACGILDQKWPEGGTLLKVLKRVFCFSTFGKS